MHSFIDTANRTWPVTITVDTIKRVRGLVGFDLLAVVEKDTLQTLIDDPVVLCDVIYAIIKPAADKAGLTDEQFAQGLGGDVLDNAVGALMEELTDFFPKAKRAVLQKILTKVEQATRFATDRAMSRLDAIDVETVVADLFEKAPSPTSSGTASGTAPASSVSTPAA